MLKKHEQAQLAGEFLLGIAEGMVLHGHMKPYGVMVGLMAALEKFAKDFIQDGTDQLGEAGRIAAIAAVRAGLESLLHTVKKIEETKVEFPPAPQAPMPPTPESIN